jgi:hypothetical protein
VAEQGHIARTAKGERPLRRALAADDQHRREQRLGQPAPPITSYRNEKHVSSRNDHENDGWATGHKAPPRTGT